MRRKRRHLSSDSEHSSSSPSSRSSSPSQKNKNFRKIFKKFKNLEREISRLSRAPSRSRQRRSRNSLPRRSPSGSPSRSSSSENEVERFQRGSKSRFSISPESRYPKGRDDRRSSAHHYPKGHDEPDQRSTCTATEPQSRVERANSSALHAPMGAEVCDTAVVKAPADHDYCQKTNDECESDVLNIDEQVSLDDSLIEIIGKDPEASGPDPKPLNEAIVHRWRHTLGNGLAKDERVTLLDKIKTPPNLMELNPPILNEEVSNVISKSTKLKDYHLTNLQLLLGKSLSALSVPLEILLSKNNGISPENNKLLLEHVSSSAKLVAHSFHLISQTRRQGLFPSLNSSVKEILEKSPPSTHLFGSDLSDKIKSAKSIQNVSKDLKPASSSVNIGSSYHQVKGGGGRRNPIAQPGPRQGNSYRPARRPRETGLKGQSSGHYLNDPKHRRPDYQRRRPFRK
ncbi:unnamed protein product [Nesidiocoris tenuis]|uniref:Retrotransposon protein n=3 Tax=Nesidiocoris tenuis TaxID=355587 RepID=A0ABN7AY41_9HEMI|nr:Retrotransposon protein [Nesidiocoris tenuis]BES99070.1 Retrotransposon protein [Nesidiocoris tenuis]CAB0010414.1 unnamed protein product [Nesidiocoris tenuis]